MTRTEQLKLFRDKCNELGQSEVARRLNKSSSAVCQLFHDNYKADPGAILQAVEVTFGMSTVICPVMGEISLKRCDDERKIPLSAASPRRIRMHNACKECGGRLEAFRQNDTNLNEV